MLCKAGALVRPDALHAKRRAARVPNGSRLMESAFRCVLRRALRCYGFEFEASERPAPTINLDVLGKL